MKIICVDDDPTFLELLRSVLTSAGFRDITVATSAAKAAQLIVDASPAFDCCFIDMRMPEIEGDYLCRWIRRLPQYKDTIIMMITATAQKQDVERAFVAGASDYMTKPIDLAELIDRAKQIARRSLPAMAPNNKQMAAAAAATQASAPDFSEPLKIEGVKRAIELSALENYLLQLSRSEVNSLSAIAYRIAEAAQIHLACTVDEFGAVLAEAAEAILQFCELSHPMIAYTGYGVFVVVADTAEFGNDDIDRIEARINQALAGLVPAAGRGAPSKVTVRMGRPQPVGSKGGQQMLDAMYRAITAAEMSSMNFRVSTA